MGNLETIGIPLAFLATVSLMAWYIIGGSGKWWIKAPVTIVSIYLSLGIWYSMNGLLGWPTEQNVPDKFQAFWIVVETPEDDVPKSGAIYVWAKSLTPEDESNFGDVPKWVDKFLIPFHNKYSKNEPRLYKLSYSEELHQQANEIIEGHLKQGRPYFGTLEGDGDGEGDGEGTGEGGGQQGRGGADGDSLGDGSGSYSRDTRPPPKFYELPPPKFPDK